MIVYLSGQIRLFLFFLPLATYSDCCWSVGVYTFGTVFHTRMSVFFIMGPVVRSNVMPVFLPINICLAAHQGVSEYLVAVTPRLHLVRVMSYWSTATYSDSSCFVGLYTLGCVLRTYMEAVMMTEPGIRVVVMYCWMLVRISFVVQPGVSDYSALTACYWRVFSVRLQSRVQRRSFCKLRGKEFIRLIGAFGFSTTAFRLAADLAVQRADGSSSPALLL